jgi:predicted Rossmann-fold nucleotide-binding protein
MTGGYGGLMGATAAGAASRGGHTVGLPMRAWTHLEPDAHHAELRWSDDYAERMRHLLQADVVVALPGGVGTLAEASAVWAAVQTEPGSANLVLVGAGWGRLVQAFTEDLVIDAADVALAHHVPSVDDVVTMVAGLLERPDESLSARG